MQRTAPLPPPPRKQLVDTSDSAHKRSLEYLFMGDHPALPGELDRAVEHGFRAPTALAAMVRGGIACVVNRCIQGRRCVEKVSDRLKHSGGAVLLSNNGVFRQVQLAPHNLYLAQGLDGAVMLSNSVGMADSLRILAALEQRALAAAAAAKAEQPGASALSAGSVAVGRIMVVKAFLGQTASDSTSIGSK